MMDDDSLVEKILNLWDQPQQPPQTIEAKRCDDCFVMPEVIPPIKHVTTMYTVRCPMCKVQFCGKTEEEALQMWNNMQ